MRRMIRTRPPLPLSVQAKARVQTWLAQANLPRQEIAAAAQVHEKTIRLAQAPDWNPRIETLRRLENAIPAGWRPKNARAAA